MQHFFILFILFFSSLITVQAEESNPHGISLDGSLGNAGNIDLQGPDFQIKPEYGKQSGTNLFHSFKSFNLYSGESATFSGPSDIDNIISRVTGGSSWINGTIKSTIPDANLYLLNPSGVMFGPDSSLDIGGSFHVSTADYLKFNENEIFYANPIKNSILTTVAPTAFGFLDADISSISIEGKGEIVNENIDTTKPTGLVVKNGETITLISGDIEINNGSFFRSKETINDYYGQPHEVDVSNKLGSLVCKQGTINLISVASEGEINIDGSSLDTSLIQKYGDITISDKSLIDVSGEGAGSIFMYGDDVVLKDSSIHANTLGADNGGIVKISANNISFINGSNISISDFGTGSGSELYLNASKNILFIGENEHFESSIIHSIAANTEDDAGDSGLINIVGDNITFSDGAKILGHTYGGGKGSDITINASSTIQFDGSNSINEMSAIFLETHSQSEKAGNGGNIILDANNILFKDGAVINCHVFGHGNAGSIKITTKNQLSFSGNNKDPYQTFIIFSLFGQETEKNQGGIVGCVLPTANGGKGSNITLECGGDISLMDGSYILSNTFGQGDGGSISIKTQGKLTLDGAIGPGAWFNACIATSTMPFGPVAGGDSGYLSINAKELVISNGASIDTATMGYYGIQSGNSGNISINVTETLKISGTNPYGRDINDIQNIVSSRIFAESVGFNNTGTAGNISIQAGNIILENGGMITTNNNGRDSCGNIYVTVREMTTITGDSSGEKYIPNPGGVPEPKNSGIYSISSGESEDSGTSGTIHLSTPSLFLENKGTISTSSKGGGNAGDIFLNLNNLLINDCAVISSASNNEDHGGYAGRITINAEDSIRLLNNSKLTTEAVNTAIKDTNDDSSGKITLTSKKLLYLFNSEITTSVKGGSGSGGDIDIYQSKFVTLNNSNIIANAYKGSGGNINIGSDYLISSTDSLIEASSNLGVDGDISISSPDLNIGSGLSVLQTSFLDASKWQSTPCADRSGENISRLIVSNRDASPTDIGDIIASPPIAYGRFAHELKKLENNNLSHIFSLVNQGHSFYRKGKIEQAIQSWEKVLNQINIKENTDIYFSLLEHLNMSYQEIGHHQKAMKWFKQVDSILKSTNNDYRKILVHSSVADLYLSLGNKKKSMLYLKKAMADAKKLKDKTVMATVMNNIGNIMMAENKYKTALKIYTKAFLLINDSQQNDLLKSALLNNILSVRMWTGRFDDTLAYLDKAISQTKRLSDSHIKLKSMTSLSYKISQLSNILVDIYGDLDQIAINLLQQSIQIAKQLNDHRVLAKNFGYMGKFYQQKGDLEKAIQHTQKAIFYAEQARTSETLYLWLWQAGRLYNRSGNKEKSIKLYQESIEKLAAIRKEIFTGHKFHKDIFNEKIRPVYQELVGLFIDMAEEESSEDLKEKYLTLALETMEHLKSAELQDYFQDECVAKNERKSNLLSRIPDNIALLYPISLPDRLIVLLCIADHIGCYKRPMSKEYFNKTVTSYRNQLQTRYSNQFLQTSKILYSYLIAPVQKDLNKHQIHTIIVSCGGKLRMIPFSTLHDGQQFLIEKYAIATIPAISLTDNQAAPVDQKEILLSGLSDAVQDFSALPSVKDELKSIQLTMKSDHVLFNKDYTKNNLATEIKNKAYSIIHLATHGVFSGTAEDSYLLTYDDKINMNDLEQLLSIGKYTHKQVDLLTLSACQTALGNERAALGLAGVAVKAGVKTAVATLWYVDDEATSMVIREMYKQLTYPDISKVKALQKAQKTLISQSKYWHPVYWAPFLLIGNWG